MKFLSRLSKSHWIGIQNKDVIYNLIAFKFSKKWTLQYYILSVIQWLKNHKTQETEILYELKLHNFNWYKIIITFDHY